MEGKWIAIMMVAPFVALLTLATVWKYFEVLRARSWIGVPGRIVSSKSVDRLVPRPGVDNGKEKRNFADVIYEFKIGNQKHRGTRVTIGEDLGNGDVAETLIRYPSGKDVTVFYNPKNPTQCVIEREPPKNFFQIMAFFIAALGAGAIVAADGLTSISNALERTLPNPKNAPFVIGFSFFAICCAGMGHAFNKESKRSGVPVPGVWILFGCAMVFAAGAYFFATTSGGKI